MRICAFKGCSREAIEGGSSCEPCLDKFEEVLVGMIADDIGRQPTEEELAGFYERLMARRPN